MKLAVFVLAILTVPLAHVARGQQRFAELGICKLTSGAEIQHCRIGYRTWGALNADRSNAILFDTWFSGTSANIAGSVGADKLVDPGKYFIVAVDALGDGVSSSPSTSRPQPGLRFPRFTIGDMVESQRRLLREVLGVERIHAVVGISMGGMQAFEWAVRHPGEVERIVPIVGTPQLTAQDLLLWTTELHTLENSTIYAHGSYTGNPPIPELRELHWLMLTTPSHRNAETTRQTFGAWDASIAGDVSFDWNDWHRQLEAMLAHDVARADGGDLARTARRVTASALVVVAEQDHMVNPEPSRAFARAMNAEIVSLDSACGHMVPNCDPSIGPRVRAFLAR